MEANQLLENNIPKYESQTQFMGAIQNMRYISNPLDELAASSTAIVFYGSPCCNLKCLIPCSCICNCSCDCGDNYQYSTLLSINAETKFLFKNIGRLDCKLCSADRMSRFSYCKSYNLSSYEQFSSNPGEESVEMVKENNCMCCGLCSYFLDVFTRPNNVLAGIVQYKGEFDDCCKCKCNFNCESCCGICSICKSLCNCKDCCKFDCSCDLCHDYYYCCDILSNSRQLIYSIYLKRYCLSCCPTDCLDKLSFVIRSGGVNVGNIELRRNCCNCCGLLGKNCTYKINFPGDATPEIKLTIINAVISIDMFLV